VTFVRRSWSKKLANISGTGHNRFMWKEFKEFAVKGNAVDLAIGVIIGAAFGGIVNSLVKDILMPPIGLITGGLDFTNKFLVLKAAPGGAALFHTPAEAAKAGAVTWNYGNFISLVINFIIIAFCVFLVVKAMNKLKRPSPAAAPVSKDCPACAMTIPIKAKRCPHCTTDLTAA
jgi:large conductance mechanosensitive channel